MALADRAVAGHFAIFIAHDHFQGISRCHYHHRAEHGLADGANVLAVKLVFNEAIIVIVVAGDAGGQPVVYRATDAGHDIAAGAAVRTLVHGGAGRELELVARLLAVQQHRTAGHVAAKQGALGATQHFHAFQVKGVEQDAVVEADVNAVDDHAHRRVNARDGAVDAETANRKVGGAAGSADIVQCHVGQAHGEVGQVADLQRFQLVGTEGGNGHRHFLGTFLALPGGDHDFFQQGRGAAAGFLGQGSGAECGCHDGAEQGGDAGCQRVFSEGLRSSGVLHVVCSF